MSEQSNELAVVSQPGELSGQTQAQALAFLPTEENIDLLKKSLADSKTVLSDADLGIFLYQAQKTGLDPLARQIYVMKRDQGGVSFMTSIDGQRLVAQRTGEYEGQTKPEWCGQDGAWREVWLDDANPAAARVGVYRKGMREPVYGVARWKSYNQGRGTWNKMPDIMLSKCAEALALRKAFPQELSGLYTPEEMNGDDAPEPPRTIATKDALAEAGRVLVEKGFSREEALLIMAGIADVDDPSELTGNRLGPVLEIVHREDADNLALYLPGLGAEDDIESATRQTQEAEVVDPPAPDDDLEPNIRKDDDEPEGERINGAQIGGLIMFVKSITGLADKADAIDFIEEVAGKKMAKILKSEVDDLKTRLKHRHLVNDQSKAKEGDKEQEPTA